MFWRILVLSSLTFMISLGMGSLSSNAEPITQSSKRITSQLDKAKLDYVVGGYLKFTNGDYKGAISDYTEAIRLNPREAQTYYMRAGVKFLLGDNYGAIGDYTEAILIEPNIPAFHKARGDVKEELGDKKGAISLTVR